MGNIILPHFPDEVLSCLYLLSWFIEQYAYRHLCELETTKKALMVGHIPLTNMDDISLIPFTILYAIIGRTELKDFDISKTWVTES